jgi:hypothetical protein
MPRAYEKPLQLISANLFIQNLLPFNICFLHFTAKPARPHKRTGFTDVAGNIGRVKTNLRLYQLSSTVDLLGGRDFGQAGHRHDIAVSATIKPAPAETLRFRTVTLKFRGAPRKRCVIGRKEYWVFAMQMAVCPNRVPRSVSSCSSRWLKTQRRRAW